MATDKMIEVGRATYWGEMAFDGVVSQADRDADWKRFGDAIDAALAAAWVPCAERLPAKDVPVLTWAPYRDSLSGFGRMEIRWIVGFEREGTPQFSAGADRGYTVGGVTHWMPLPARPKDL